ncbi:MAG TPA: M20/M25/M40 family metallo-hydrolase [Bryobacteraceae bacterium]|nr:M20/M25/M40 family metallo-hydrolase [Bryobacteraceae bacterium]
MTRSLLSIFLVALVAQAQTDPDLLARLHAEAMERSQVEPVFNTFTVSIGPRLTASPAHKKAAEFARERLVSYGLTNAHLEPFRFGRGWELQKLTIEMIEPRYLPLLAYADAWSPSTNGEVIGTPVFLGGKSPEGTPVKGAIVMTAPLMSNFVRKDRPQPSDPNYVPMSAAYATSVGQAGRAAAPNPARRAAQLAGEAGAAVILKPSIGEHGTVFVTGSKDGPPGGAPTVTLSGEQYNMIAGMLAQNIPVKLRINVQTKFYDADNGNAYNVIAELPGTDLRDEIVMIGGHLDSWHTGVGATDNADGSTTVMEAMRILKAAGARPRRTIRVSLWGGEEQGMVGSRAWVAEHLAGAAKEKFDVYYNIDNGTGPIYGWYLQNNEGVRTLFDAWLEPLKSAGARRNVIEPVGSTDHMSFLEAGVPGFNPIQDYTGYDVRTHHTNMDTVDRVDVKDIRQAALVMAWFAYNSAMSDQKIPRPASK